MAWRCHGRRAIEKLLDREPSEDRVRRDRAARHRGGDVRLPDRDEPRLGGLGRTERTWETAPTCRTISWLRW